MYDQFNSGGKEESGMLDGGGDWFSKLVRKKIKDFWGEGSSKQTNSEQHSSIIIISSINTKYYHHQHQPPDHPLAGQESQVAAWIPDIEIKYHDSILYVSINSFKAL
jgi:hypothetical protein